ncbi:MAG: hypothetical protein EXR72_25840 [Myxococcales bacterium]|nr:hypothetical protein [Myxococcales bacterium]
MSLRDNDVKAARKKGFVAAAATGGAVALMVVGAPVLGVVALVPAAYLGWDWFSYRAKRGMRF